MKAVERTLKRDPEASLDKLRAAASRADESVKNVPPRSFNASYALPAKRKLGIIRTARKRKPTPKTRKHRRVPKRHQPKQATSVDPAIREAARKLVLDRDREVARTLTGDADPQAAYALATTEVDKLIDELARALTR